MIPLIIGRDPKRLERANGQLFGAQTVSQQFLGPPAGGILYTLAAWVPFLADATSFAASSALIAAIRGRFAPERAADAPRARLRADIAEGLRWLLRHRLLRATAGMAGVINLAFTAATSILVLFAQDELGLGSIGYGLLFTGLAAGGLLGSLIAGRLSQRFGAGTVLLAGVAVEAANAALIATTSSPWVAGAALGLVGFSGTVWNVVGVSLRQALVPDHIQGRVVSAYRLIGLGSIPLGALLGGLLARTFGLRAPFLFTATILAGLAIV